MSWWAWAYAPTHRHSHDEWCARDVEQQGCHGGPGHMHARHLVVLLCNGEYIYIYIYMLPNRFRTHSSTSFGRLRNSWELELDCFLAHADVFLAMACDRITDSINLFCQACPFYNHAGLPSSESFHACMLTHF
jgi:hypothetical protein